MDKAVAIRIDGMLMGARAYLDGMAHYMKNNLSADDYASLIPLIGAAMAETVEFSSRLHTAFPDIVPKEISLGK